MSDLLTPAPSPTPAGLNFDFSPRRALATLSTDDLAVWHLRYCPQEGLEMRARAALANVERELRAAGAEVTIHALWVELADRAGQDDEPDVKAAAALAGMALGLRAG
ncbi:MAG: hypothetical protein ACRYHQ_39285 [Janthinobacterium lividum]